MGENARHRTHHLHDFQEAWQCPHVGRIEPHIGLNGRAGGRHGRRGGVLPRKTLFHHLRLL